MRLFIAYLLVCVGNLQWDKKERFSAGLTWVLCAMLLLSACGTANNYRMPPYEVKRVEMTCDRKTTGLPAGLMCYCVAYGSSWDCNVVRY